MTTTHPEAILGDILRGMALAFFASAFADQAEEAGQPVQGEIMDQLPRKIDPEAWNATHRLAWFIGRANRHLDTRNWVPTVREVYEAYPAGLDPKTWGHYAAMSAMGHGTGLWEYTEEVKVPDLEFTGLHLERNYFTGEEN